MRIYFTGASGTGKTTLANYISQEYGIDSLPSAARTVISRNGLDDTRFQELLSDPARYEEFQRNVFIEQVDMEKAADSRLGSFVSDRCLDHLVFCALYSRNSHKIAGSEMFHEYMKKLRDMDSVIFHVRPTWPCYHAARAEGKRLEFLDWPAMQRFDGAVEFMLEINNISRTPITSSDMRERHRIIDSVLARAGMLKKGAVPVQATKPMKEETVQGQDTDGRIIYWDLSKVAGEMIKWMAQKGYKFEDLPPIYELPPDCPIKSFRLRIDGINTVLDTVKQVFEVKEGKQ